MWDTKSMWDPKERRFGRWRKRFPMLEMETGIGKTLVKKRLMLLNRASII